MAIKEFQVQPQIYFEEKYFDGDYFYNNSEIRTQLTATANIIKNVDAVMSNEFAVVADNLRVRFGQVTLDNYLQEGYYATGYFETRGAIYSLSAVAEVIVIGEVKEFDAELLAASTLVVEQTTIKDTAANMSAEFALSASAGRIQQAQCNFQALFEPSFTVNAVTNTFAVLDSTAALATVATANRSADIALASIINLGLQGDKVTGYVAALDAEFQQTADNLRTRNESAQLSADFVVSAVNDRTRTDTATVSAEFDTVTVNDRIRNSAALVTVVSELAVQAKEIVQLSAVLAASTTLDTALSIEKQFAADLGALFEPNFSVNAVTNTFAVLDTVSTVSADVEVSRAVSVNMPAISSLQTTALKIKQLESLPQVGGVQFRNGNVVYIVDGIVGGVNNFQTPRITSVFAMSFWANNPQGVMLDTFTGDQTNDVVYDRGGYFNFKAQSLEFVSYSQDRIAPISYSNVTWNLPDKKGWHHYLIDYQVEPAGATTPTIVKRNLYVDGVLMPQPVVDRAITPGTDGKGEGPDSLALYWAPATGGGSGVTWPQLLWTLGADSVTPYTDGLVVSNTRVRTTFSGGVTQLAVWYQDVRTVPQFDELSERQKLYVDGYQDLGPTGTLTGLAQPEIYLRLNDSSDIGHRGQQVLDNTWRQDTSGGAGPTEPYTPTAIDDAPGSNVVQAFLTASAIASNQGFINYVLTTSLTVDSLVIQPLAAEISAEFALEASSYEFATADADLTASFEQSLDYTRLRDTAIELTAEFDAVIVATETSDFAAELDSEFAANIDAMKIQQSSVPLSSEFLSTINGTVIAVDSAVLSADTALAAQPLRIFDLSAELEGFAAVVQVTSKIAGFFVNCDVVSTLTATVTTSVDNSAELESLTDITVTVRKITDVTADIIVNSQQSTDAKRFRSTVEEFDVTAVMTVITEFSKITRTGAAEYTAEFTQSTVTDNSKIVDAVATVTAAFTSDLTPDLFKRYTVNTTAVTDTAVTAVKTVSAIAVFDSIAVKLIDSDVLSYDRALTLTVPGEFRTLSLHEEPLILMVEPETRVNMVRKTA